MKSLKRILFLSFIIALAFHAVRAQSGEEEDGLECHEGILHERVNGVCMDFIACCFDPREGCEFRTSSGCFWPSDCMGPECVYTAPNVCEACINDLGANYSPNPCPVGKGIKI